MKEGTKVKVVASITGHYFDIGEIVERRYLDNEYEHAVGFHSERCGQWYMSAEEYKVWDKQYAVELAAQASIKS